MLEEFKSVQPSVIRPTPVDKEVNWDKSKIIISETDTFGTITNVNEVFTEVCGYTAAELIGQPHNLIRHPDVPKLMYKILWDNLKNGNNFAGVVKNLAKSGEYYWVITDFEMRRDGMGNITHYIAKRKAAPQNVVDYVASLYETLIKLEKVGGMELSGRFFKNFLDKQGKDYMDFIIGLLEENKQEMKATEMSMTFEDNKDAEQVSDEIYQVKGAMNEKRKNFFARLFS